VVANNSSQRSGGFRVKGNWTCNNVMFLGNQILEGYGTIGPEANAGSSSVNVEGPYVDGFKGVTARGFVLRGNQLENASQIFIRGSVHDVLIERNEIRNTRRGIFADQSGRQQGVLVRENAFDNVENPLEPPQPETWDVRK
jgi:nitrous oxidase accessory protein NosD